MYGSTAVCKRTVTFDEFAQRKSAGEIVESVVHEGFVYFLTEEVWGETLPNGNHVDGVMVLVSTEFLVTLSWIVRNRV
jgi:hypothetical protein